MSHTNAKIFFQLINNVDENLKDKFWTRPHKQQQQNDMGQNAKQTTILMHILRNA
jgi:hypothetical protein